MIRDPRLRTLAAVGLLVVSLVVPAVGVAASDRRTTPAGSLVAGTADTADNPCVGTITGEPSGTTLFTIQGARAGEKTAAMAVSVAPDGTIRGVHNDTAAGRWWLYDIDREPDGSLLAATTQSGITVVESIDPATGDHEWTWELPNVKDAHDVDHLGDGEYVLPDKGDGRNRLVIYNRTTGELVWEWRFDERFDRFPKSGGGPYEDDWTHVNDVDVIREGVFLVSVRNFDQVIAVERESKEILWTLGEDDAYGTLDEQHNPDYIEGANGTDTLLVADSENDRVVEYAREDGEWVETWELTGPNLVEPRDADRLPNGNTLIADRRGHRIIEVTPRGEIVWEVYAPWQPYDAERIGTGDESNGPTARQLGATGSYETSGSAAFTSEEIEGCYAYLTGLDRSRLLADGEIPATATASDAPTDRTTRADWTTVPETSASEVSGPMVGVVVALLVIGGVVILRRRSS